MKSKYILNNAIYTESPNCDQRPNDSVVDTIVIHCISLPEKVYDNDNVIDFFTNKLKYNEHSSFDSLRNLNVSSHIFIRRTGKVIQFVPFNKRAWHAGKSHYEGRSNFNDFSIGIEMEGSIDDIYTNNQYKELKEIILNLKELYPSIKDSNIIGHSDIAPGRKTDPGENFLWNRVI